MGIDRSIFNPKQNGGLEIEEIKEGCQSQNPRTSGNQKNIFKLEYGNHKEKLDIVNIAKLNTST